MKKVIKLTESDVLDLVKKVIKEQETVSIKDYMAGAKGFKTKPINNPPNPDEKYGNSVGPGKEFQKGQYTPTVTLPSNLFKNGIDKIDMNSDAFRKGIDAIQKAVTSKGQNITINVEGGASAVGKKEGYDNDALAKRRAQNFVNSVNKEFPNVKFNISTKVGEATVKNSPAAEKEQYVKLTFPGTMSPSKTAQAVDNTQLVMRFKKPIKPVEQKEVNKKIYYKVCYWVPRESFEVALSSVQKVGGIEV